MPGVEHFVGFGYKRLPEEFSQFFDTRSSDKNFEEGVMQYGFGLAAVLPEGTAVTYDVAGQAGVQRYPMIKYGRGFMITEEAIADNQYQAQIPQLAMSLGDGLRQVIENTAANILNRANSSSYTGVDGIELSSAVHVKGKGGTYSNELATASPLSELSLEQACIDIGGFEDEAGLKISSMGMKLIIPRQLEFETQRILKSELKNDTAENALNILKSGRYLPQGFCLNHYLSSASKWFVKTNVMNGLTHFAREAMSIKNDTVFDSGNLKYMVKRRDAFGWTDPRGIFCNGE